MIDIVRDNSFESKEEVEKVCNKYDECLGYYEEKGKYYLLATKIIKGDFTLCVKKSKQINDHDPK